VRSCKDVSFLLSRSLDRPLPWTTRLSLRMHLMMCSFCRVARRQTLAMREILNVYGGTAVAGETEDQPGLPDEVRERIKDHVREAVKEQPDC